MSARISPSLPRSPQISDDRKDELFAFDGVDALWNSWRDGLTPDPSLLVSEWADRLRFLSPRASAEPSRYRTGRTPYMRAIMDALSPSNPCRRIVLMKAAQVGATEAGNNWIGYVIHHAPEPMLAVRPTVELAKRFSRQRIDPAFAVETLRVSYDGSTVAYGSEDDLLKRIRAIEREMATTSNFSS